MNSWRSHENSPQENTESENTAPPTTVFPPANPQNGYVPQPQDETRAIPLYTPQYFGNNIPYGAPPSNTGQNLNPHPYGAFHQPAAPSNIPGHTQVHYQHQPSFIQNQNYANPNISPIHAQMSPVNPVPSHNGTKYALAIIGFLGIVGLMFILALWVIFYQHSSRNSEASQTTTTIGESEIRRPPEPNPLPIPPQNPTTNEPPVTIAQEEEIRRAVQNFFPPEIGQKITLELCQQNTFLLDENFYEIDCAVPSGITSDTIDIVGVITDPEAIRILTEDFEYPKWKYIKSAPDHDFHLMQEYPYEEGTYITSAYDHHGEDIAILYIVFADERIASDYFVKLGLAQYA
ncbi:hypothetical protein [Corynebacterium freiburgense]|uniref:hypothetical protein n=1 Tax=Corynebacterium freiburgense TaxID=556548 RepID=UPI00040DDCE8|nr:hypothetical protein [Corynebacterium freiburgense]WJZ02525.1 hypothetical protein CFREI_06175 [Corynebacterium freiburgense]